MNRPLRSARLPLPIPTTTSFTPGLAKPASAAICPMATECSNRLMADNPGRTLDCATLSTSARSLLTPGTPTLCSSQLWATPMVRIPSEGFFAPATAARLGRRFYTKTITPAQLTLCSIRITQTFSSLRCGRSRAPLTVWTAADQAADCTNPAMAAPPGGVLRGTACQTELWEESE